MNQFSNLESENQFSHISADDNSEGDGEALRRYKESLPGLAQAATSESGHAVAR